MEGITFIKLKAWNPEPANPIAKVKQMRVKKIVKQIKAVDSCFRMREILFVRIVLARRWQKNWIRRLKTRLTSKVTPTKDVQWTELNKIFRFSSLNSKNFSLVIWKVCKICPDYANFKALVLNSTMIKCSESFKFVVQRYENVV